MSSLPQSPIWEQWTLVRSHPPSLPGIAEVLRNFFASPPAVQQIVGSPAASPDEAEAANQAGGATKTKGYTPQKGTPRCSPRHHGWCGKRSMTPRRGKWTWGWLGGILRDQFGAGLPSISDT